MQSTWENLVDYDMSESGVRPLTLRELVDDGVRPRGLSRLSRSATASRTARSSCASGSRRSTRARRVDHIEVTNGTSEANYLIALQLSCGRATTWRWRCRTTCRCRASRAASAPTVRTFRLRQDTGWEPDWDEFERAVTPEHAAALPLESRTTRPAPSCRTTRCSASSSAASRPGTWLLADEVYLGAEIDRPRTTSFWGMSDRVIVTSGLSKAYGIPGVRIGWIVGPPDLVARLLDAARLPDDRPEQDVGSDGAGRGRAGRTASAVTRGRATILRHNLPIAREWVGELRRPADLARAAGRRHRAASGTTAEVASLRDRRARARAARAR